MLKAIVHVLLAAALLAAGGAGAQVREHTIKLAFAISGDNPQTRGAAFFKSEVERLSGGRMTVTLYPGSQLGPDLQVLSGLRAGAIEAQLTTTSLLGGIGRAFNVYDIPFLFRDFRELYAVSDGEPGRRLRDIGQENGFVILNLHSGAWRNLTNRTRPVASVQDIKGLKLRTLQSAVFIDFWKALGANPVALPFPELYTALEQGTVDGQENANGVTVFAKLTEVQKHYTATQHNAYVGVLLFSGPVWQRLNEDERSVLRQAGSSSQQFWRQALVDNDAVLLRTIGQKLTVTPLSPVARAEMERLAQPVIDKYMAALDPDLARQVRAAIASVRER
ncbi:TRAP transporter substrate-binding protein [Aquabacterium sp.]|uniref:TRAP transporter substrate-binding protein n=1 Tax=Aquabacterium sp. TaxID=1872578 RepID=UPI002CE3074D|nr:TRAP transporter substrate-binding protein [Aquabacterium sp.]HSW03951.1 TRAP transporter substrate-binding protein [Aquabacterium sp.]